MNDELLALLVQRRDEVERELAGEFNPKRADQSVAYFALKGEIRGLNTAIDAHMQHTARPPFGSDSSGYTRV